MKEVINSGIIGAFFWAIIILVFIAGYRISSEDSKLKYHLKCIEMREMPLGACSRLFGEK